MDSGDLAVQFPDQRDRSAGSSRRIGPGDCRLGAGLRSPWSDYGLLRRRWALDPTALTVDKQHVIDVTGSGGQLDRRGRGGLGGSVGTLSKLCRRRVQVIRTQFVVDGDIALVTRDIELSATSGN